MSSPRAQGALLLLFDVADDAIAEHDDWHTHEHMPERLAIPGFLRGTRWTRTTPGPRYCVIYEVESPAVLGSPAYRARLDAPTPWTTRMMACYSGMRRTLCEVVAADEREAAARTALPGSARATASSWPIFLKLM